MTNEVTPVKQTGKEENITKPIEELSEDMELVSPGAMLREARKEKSLSQEYISSKLNFKVTIVEDIENNIFDPLIPVTFNRGYLANYAKLVGVEVDDVLASYDALDAASIQRSEMLSFSKETFKQAEHSRVMWLSYLIVAVLIGLTVLWWLQESNQQAANTSAVIAPPAVADVDKVNGELAQNKDESSTAEETQLIEIENKGDLPVNTNSQPEGVDDVEVNEEVVSDDVIAQQLPEPVVQESTAVFTFIGDCWVNIYDATGERIAWGVKKSGYVMTIQGKAPLSITVGKPELTSIVFNGQSVDMSAFDVGNIAKFNLPILVE